jgi:hypothetical protein
MTDFRKMDTEDWKIHAARAWEVAGIFVTEMQRRKNSDGASEPLKHTHNDTRTSKRNPHG